MVFGALRNSLSKQIICKKKVKIFAEKIEGLSSFKVDNGWLWNLKARHVIRELDLSDEKLSAENFNEKLIF